MEGKKRKGENFYREAIAEVNKKNKNSCTLEKLYKIADLFYRAYDEEMYKTMTDEEWNLLSCIRKILSLKASDLECAKSVIDLI